MHHFVDAVAIESRLLSHVTGGTGRPQPQPQPQPNVREQCGLPPPEGRSNRWRFQADLPLSRIPVVGRYLPDIHIGGDGQRTSDYQSCVNAVTGHH